MLAHIGVAVCLLGVSLNTIYSEQRDMRMVPGETVSQGRFEYTFEGTKGVRGPNYVADVGTIVVSDEGKEISRLHPEKRRYLSGGNIMTEAGIDAGFMRDLYVALGESLGQGAWAVRLHYKPYVRWIWLGAIFMALGGLLAILDKRYRAVKIKREQPVFVDSSQTI